LQGLVEPIGQQACRHLNEADHDAACQVGIRASQAAVAQRPALIRGRSPLDMDGLKAFNDWNWRGQHQQRQQQGAAQQWMTSGEASLRSGGSGTSALANAALHDMSGSAAQQPEDEYWAEQCLL